jgi:hypothetical protein
MRSGVGDSVSIKGSALKALAGIPRAERKHLVEAIGRLRTDA